MLNRRELLGAASVIALSPGIAWAQAKNAADTPSRLPRNMLELKSPSCGKRGCNLSTR